jgi:hypothetical protein
MNISSPALEVVADSHELRGLLAPESNATFVRVTFVSQQPIAPGGLPAPFARSVIND